MNETPSPVVAVAGTDPWLRAAIGERLKHAGIVVSNIGTGSASLRGVDILVYAPSVTPLSGRPAKDAGTSAAAMTFAAAAGSGVRRAVLVTGVGTHRAEVGSYRAELGLIERTAASALATVTVIRVAHPFGSIDDAGPLLARLLAHIRSSPDGLDRLGEARVQPVFIDDITCVVQAAVTGRVGAGAVELGGPFTMSLAEFAHQVHQYAGTARGRRTLSSLLPSPRRRILQQFLAEDSVAASRFAAPIDLRFRGLEDVWKRAAIGEAS